MQKIYHIINYIMLLLLVCSLSGFVIQSYQLGITRQQLDYYRTEFESAQNRQQEAFDIIDGCYRDVERASEILSQSVNTISDIRRQISEIRENYEIMEDRMLLFYDNNNRTNNSNWPNKVGE